jgi:hypothetical protein
LEKIEYKIAPQWCHSPDDKNQPGVSINVEEYTPGSWFDAFILWDGSMKHISVTVHHNSFSFKLPGFIPTLSRLHESQNRHNHLHKNKYNEGIYKQLERMDPKLIVFIED